MTTWVRTGSVTVTNGSATVTGSGTSWVDNVNVGDAFHAPDGRVYEVISVVSATQVTLHTAYLGPTASAASYGIQPTRSFARQLVQDVQQLLTDFTDVRDNAGQGRFGFGSVGAPGLSFLGDLDSGVRRSSSNRIALVGGGLDLLELGEDYAVGEAVQSGSTDKTSNRLLKLNGTTGCFGLGATNLPGLTDANALLGGGSGIFAAFDDVNMPETGAFVLLHFDRTANATAVQLAQKHGTDQLFMRSYNAGSWTTWVELLSGSQIKPPITVTVANDAAAAIDLEGWDGIASIKAASGPGFALSHLSGLVFLDAGSSPDIRWASRNTVGTSVELTTGVLTGTDGSDGVTTWATHTDGFLRIENRTGGALTFEIGFGGTV